MRIAAATGARVIAMGRSEDALEQLGRISDRVATVKISGDVEEDVEALARFGPLDVFFDISPDSAKDSGEHHSVEARRAREPHGGPKGRRWVPIRTVRSQGAHNQRKIYEHRPASERLD